MAEMWTIGEAARRAGIRTSALRYYESVGLLPAPGRMGGQRRYPPAVLDQLSFIRVAQSLGFSLTEIQALFGPSAGADGAALPERWQALARHKLAEVDALIRRAEEMKRRLHRGLQCDCPNRDECIDCVLRNCSDAE